ncbi:hypothetical protein J6590_033456 [Homalodisca vitripennis]|nr:hypothetical protein J6590_033456 [Homalodisca vitripennis]
MGAWSCANADNCAAIGPHGKPCRVLIGRSVTSVTNCQLFDNCTLSTLLEMMSGC